VAAPEVIAEIEKARLPFVVDAFAESVALALLERPSLVAQRVAEVVMERERLVDTLGRRSDVSIIPGAANFFLLQSPLAPSELVDALARRGVRVRSMSPYRALGPDAPGRGWVRVSVGSPQENRAFELALDEALR
jgi:histidinol-phosphate aminotransferase